MPMVMMFTEVATRDHTDEMHVEWKADDAWWSEREECGIQYMDRQPVLVLKQCTCGSTLARPCRLPLDAEYVDELAERADWCRSGGCA